MQPAGEVVVDGQDVHLHPEQPGPLLERPAELEAPATEGHEQASATEPEPEALYDL